MEKGYSILNVSMSDEIVGFITRLKTKCVRFQNDKMEVCDNCEIDKSPILKLNHMNTRVFFVNARV